MSEILLDKLNKKQKEAVETHNGPVLIIAGAGTGKTRTLTSRIASIINSGVKPQKILAITFTNKAASEMKERVNILLKNEKNVFEIQSPFISTFHSLGVFILRNHFKEAGLEKNFSIADRQRSKQILKEVFRKNDIDNKSNDINKTLSYISKQKNNLSKTKDKPQYFFNFKIDILKEYEKLLKEESLVDFDDLLIKPLEILKKNPEIRNLYQEYWSHIHVDEYQDTNDIQCKLIDLLTKKHQNICVTGDLDQCIYSWRGANVDTMLNFEKNYPKTKTIILEENYRSTKNILNAANKVISFNNQRKEKNLHTVNKEGEKIEYFIASSESREAEIITEKTQNLLKEGIEPSNIAVLYRTNFQSRSLEEAFLRKNIPYTVIGTKFLERQEIKDVISYLETSLNKKNISSLKRIINVPTRGIGKVTLNKFLEGKEKDLPNKTKEKIEIFKRLIDKINKKSTETNPSELVKYVLEETGLSKWYKERGEDERLENVRELVTLASQYDHKGPEEGLRYFMEHVSLFNDQDSIPPEETQNIKLMTVHAAKGLEFDYIFISGLEEGLFPHDPITEETRDEEEERRLFYVALTRAKVKAFLSSAYMRTIFGKTNLQNPSRFISDIGEEYISTDFLFEEDEEDSGLLSGPPLPPIY